MENELSQNKQRAAPIPESLRTHEKAKLTVLLKLNKNISLAYIMKDYVKNSGNINILNQH